MSTTVLGRTIDDFEDGSAWRTVVGGGAKVALHVFKGLHGKSLRIDYDFTHGGGEVLVHKAFSEALPARYEIQFAARSSGTINPLELRLLDPALTNVWVQRRGLPLLSPSWRQISVKTRHLDFGWGPAGGGQPVRIGMIEFAIRHERGGKGTLWLDDLSLMHLPESATQTPEPISTASFVADRTAAVTSTPSSVGWDLRSARGDRQWLLLDLGSRRELGGLVLRWDKLDFARRYNVELSDDGRTWRHGFSVRDGDGGTDLIPIPDEDCRFVRLTLRQSSRHHGYFLRRIDIEPYEFSATWNHFSRALAAHASRGSYPRYLSNEQNYWTTVGTAGSADRGNTHVALLSEDGVFEPQKGGASLEPFISVGNKLLTWNDAVTSQRMVMQGMPLPEVVLRYREVKLTIEAVAHNSRIGPQGLLRYTLRNTGRRRLRGNFFVAVRPFQVVPPWQSVNMEAGTAPIFDIGLASRRHVTVNGKAFCLPLTPPASFHGLRYAGASFENTLLGKLPLSMYVHDRSGYATGVLRYRLDIAPGAQRQFVLQTALDKAAGLAQADHPSALRHWQSMRHSALKEWRSTLKRTSIRLPVKLAAAEATVTSALAHILMSRDGPRLRPGARTYGRVWIRDGALMSLALLQFGHPREARVFIEWYAERQRNNGSIPCCLDPWGPDAMVEHDAEGQFIFAVAEYFRFTRDRAWLRRLWPTVHKAVGYIDALRKERLTDAYRTYADGIFFGLVPESASHEGYAAHPVHAYWDDFWALRGVSDALFVARELGVLATQTRLEKLLLEFRTDVYASINKVARTHALDYVPAAAELADFDPSALAIAISPLTELAHLPRAALESSFAKFLAERDRDREVYSPYEIRVVPALVRLGKPVQAAELLASLIHDQRPSQWHQWPEVVWRNYRTPRFIGDLPHAWISAEFLRAVRSMIVDENAAERKLVLGSGIAPDSLGVGDEWRVQRMPTYWGTLDFGIKRKNAHRLIAEISGSFSPELHSIELHVPLTSDVRRVLVNNRPAHLVGDHLLALKTWPAVIVIDTP